MKFKKYTGITWSVLELTALLEDEDSHVSFEKFKKHLGLHPFHLTNLTAALNEILSSNLNFYDTELKGFVLAYKNPKLLTPLGDIFYDTCFIHIDIEADFYIFKPEVGSSLKGIVSKKGLDHIGVLVHKAFNVSIPKLDDEEDWVGDNLEIGQEVRFAITHLDFTSKLPYIRGVLNPSDYLQGCRLTEKVSNSLDNNNQDGTDRSRKTTKQSKRHTFHGIDSANTSEEDLSQIKKKRDKHKKLNKTIEIEMTEPTEKAKKGKKHSKKVQELEESKPMLNDTETMSTGYTNSIFTNNKFIDNEESEESISPKHKYKKKSKSHGSQSSINEDFIEESEEYPSKKISNRLFDTESKDKINKTKLKQSRTSNGTEWNIEENMFEHKPKSKKNTKKRKDLDSDHSSDEFSSYKYIKYSNKKDANSSIESEGVLPNIKIENLSDTNEVNNRINTSPKTKCNENSEKVSLKGKNRKSKIFDCDSTYQNVKIKTEKVTSDSENAQEDDYIKTCKVSRMDSKLNISTISSCDLVEVEDDESNTKKKHKRHSEIKIKAEPEFEGIVTKVEKPDDTYQEDSMKNLSKINSPKKKRKVNLPNNNDSDEMDTKSNVKHFNKIKPTDEDMIYNIKEERESSVASIGSNDDSYRYTRKNRKNLISSPSKNKSRQLELDFEFSNVRVKTEKFTDD
nr:DNA-directed RNA polymerase I subunit RPA43 [Osmia lignaria]